MVSMLFDKDHRNKIIYCIFFILLVISMYLRFYNLGKLDLWIDEPYHVYSAKALIETGEPALPSGMIYGRAIIYTHLVALSYKIFGINEFSTRFPSALLSIFNIILIFFIGRNLLGNKVALVVTFFLAFSYYELAWSRISRFYTLFQFFYLLGVFLIYKGIETKNKFLTNVKNINYFKSLNLNWTWLIVGSIVLLLSFTVQLLAAMFYVIILIYSMLFLIYFLSKKDNIVRNKYFFISISLILIFLIGYFFFDLDSLLKWAFSYKPHWADSPSFQNKYYYFNYLTSSTMFPLSAFFLIGAIHTITRCSKAAFFLLLNFLVPFAILSVLFSYKLTNYMFHIFPFYLLIGAYGIVNVYNDELKGIIEKYSFLKYKPGIIKTVFFLVMFGWIPITLWFKIGVKMPNMKVGKYNLVYTHRNWKWAANYIKDHKGNDDIIISSIPLTLKYYGVECDYNLNNGMINEIKERNCRDANNKLLDVYAGVPIIFNLKELKDITGNNREGWLIFDVYSFKSETCISSDIMDYIDNNFELAATDNKNTILIYHWKKE